MAGTILLVDDSTIMLMAIDLVLRKAGFTVVKSTSGEEALEKLHNDVLPDLVITDLNMGVMNGIDFIRNVRELPSMQSTPIMVLAADASKGSRDQAKSAGANGWMVKPVPFDGLMQVVRQLLASDCLLQERTA